MAFAVANQVCAGRYWVFLPKPGITVAQPHFSVERFLILAKNYETFPFEVFENIFPLVFYSHAQVGGFL